MATAFEVRLLGTALVVHFDPAEMIGEETHSGLLPGKSVESGDAYQSGSKQRRPKGSADLCTGFVYVAGQRNMRASRVNAAGGGSELADELFRCGIFPTDCGNIPISWVRMPISLWVAK